MLKTIYDNEADIPEGYAALYTEKNGKWELTGVTGVKTQADIDRINEALRKEKADHKAAKDALKPFEGIDPEAHHTLATELEETKAQLDAVKKDGTIDETKLEPIISARVKQMVAPVERDKAALQKQLDAQKLATAAKETETIELRQTIVTGEVERAIRDAAIAAKVLPTAVGDVVLRGLRNFERTDDGRIITKDGAGTPGLTPAEWLKDEMERSPHWWPASVGGGSNGGGGGGKGGYHGANNPWSKAGWNVTKQGQLVTSLGAVKAGDIAALAGCKLGDTKPQAA